MKDAYLAPNGYSYWRMYQHGTYGSCTINSAFACEENLTGGSTVPNRWANNDFGIVCWWGHGNSQGAYVSYSPCSVSSFLLSSNAPSLDDVHPSHTYQCSCLNGQPEDSLNLQYAILKKGGITTTGATRVSWYYVGQTSYAGSSSNAGMGYEYVKRLVQEMPAGEALYRMKSSGVYPPGGSAEVLMNFYVMCLDGDPSVSIKRVLGIDKLGVYYPDAGAFFLDANGDNVWETAVPMGGQGDLPVSGDWNGDGKDELGVYYPPVGAFFLDANGDNIWETCVPMGGQGDLPVSGRWG